MFKDRGFTAQYGKMCQAYNFFLLIYNATGPGTIPIIERPALTRARISVEESFTGLMMSLRNPFGGLLNEYPGRAATTKRASFSILLILCQDRSSLRESAPVIKKSSVFKPNLLLNPCSVCTV